MATPSSEPATAATSSSGMPRAPTPWPSQAELQVHRAGRPAPPPTCKTAPLQNKWPTHSQDWRLLLYTSTEDVQLRNREAALSCTATDQVECKTRLSQCGDVSSYFVGANYTAAGLQCVAESIEEHGIIQRTRCKLTSVLALPYLQSLRIRFLLVPSAWRYV